MLCGRTVIGAQFVDADLRDHMLFTIFEIQRSLIHLNPAPESILVLGLGAGVAPSSFRKAGIVTDVIEINEAVVDAATKFLGYDSSAESPGTLGSTYVADAHDHVFANRKQGARLYDL